MYCIIVTKDPCMEDLVIYCFYSSLTSFDKRHCLWLAEMKNSMLLFWCHIWHLKIDSSRPCRCLGMTFWPSFAMTFDQFQQNWKFSIMNKLPVLNPSIWYHTWHTLKVIHESRHIDMTFDLIWHWPLTYFKIFKISN